MCCKYIFEKYTSNAIRAIGIRAIGFRAIGKRPFLQFGESEIRGIHPLRSKRCLENNFPKIARIRSTHRENISRRQFRSNLDKFWLKVNLRFIARKVKSAPFRILSGSPFRVQNKLLSSRFRRRYQEYFSSLVELSFKEGILKVEVSC